MTREEVEAHNEAQVRGISTQALGGEKMENPDWHLKQELDEAKRERDNARSRCIAAEDELVRMRAAFQARTEQLEVAWKERDEMRKLMIDSDKVVVASATLIAYLAARVK